MGDPNSEDGEYQKSLPLLYGVAYALKMSYKTKRKIEGYFEYVVPPLEGFWWQDGIKGVDYSKKDQFQFIALIRLPEFMTKEDVEWAKETISQKKKMDFSKVEFFEYHEGLVVQAMHIGPYTEEPKTVDKMHDYMNKAGYQLDISDERYHHEIYISDPRRMSQDKLKTVLRHPKKKLHSERKLLMHIALIAHDKKKDEMVKLTLAYKDILSKHNLYATGTTGTRIIEATGLDVSRFKSGPLGGDQQIGSMVAENRLDLIIFLRDSLTAQAHEPDITALLRLSDLYDVPMATNMGSAEVMLRGLESKFFQWREITRGHDRDQL